MAFVSFDMAAINFLRTTLEKQDPLVHRSPPRFPSWPPLTRFDQLHPQFSTTSFLPPNSRFLASPSFPPRPQIFLRPLSFACFPRRRFYTPPRRCVATLSFPAINKRDRQFGVLTFSGERLSLDLYY